MLPLNYSPIFGYESKHVCYKETQYYNYKNENIFKIQTSLFACIPIINIVMSTKILYEIDKDYSKSIKAQIISRCVMHIVCPPLVILADLLATAILHLMYLHTKCQNRLEPLPPRQMNEHLFEADVFPKMTA